MTEGGCIVGIKDTSTAPPSTDQGIGVSNTSEYATYPWIRYGNLFFYT
jgi:hypothetical protein